MKMYFSRFKLEALTRAVAKETVSTDEYCYILEFYTHDKMRLLKEDYEKISKILDVETVENIENSDALIVRIKQYPWCKENCLHFAPSNPRYWKFLDEMYKNALFEYTVGVPCGKLTVNSSVTGQLYDRSSVLGPTPFSLDSLAHAPGHGFD